MCLLVSGNLPISLVGPHVRLVSSCLGGLSIRKRKNDSKLITLPSVGLTWLHTLSLGAAFLFSSWAPKLLHILAVNPTPTVHGHTS